MTYLYLAVLFLSSLAGVTSQLLFKRSTLGLGHAPGEPAKYTHFFLQLLLMPQFLIALFLYGVSFVLWIYILSRNPLSVLYPVALSTNVILSILYSQFVLGEVVSLIQLFGIAAIILGMFLVLK